MLTSAFSRRTDGHWASPSERATTSKTRRSRPTRGTILVDICLVVMWGATIPGMMWLGAAGGF